MSASGRGSWMFAVVFIVLAFAAQLACAEQVTSKEAEKPRGARAAPDYLADNMPWEEYLASGKENTASLDELEKLAGDRPLLTFWRAEPGAILPESKPFEEELRDKIAVRLTPGEHEPIWFGVLPVKDLAGCSLQVGSKVVSPIRIADGLTAELRVARYWPQQIINNIAALYQIVPEMLELPTAFDLKRGRVKLVWLTLKASEDCKPGKYSTRLSLVGFDEAEGLPTKTKLVTADIEVLPFALSPLGEDQHALITGDFHRRWPRWTDEQITKELKDIHAHGFDAVRINPMFWILRQTPGGKDEPETNPNWKYDREARKWKINFGMLPRFIKLMKENGFRVIVYGTMSVEPLIAEHLGIPVARPYPMVAEPSPYEHEVFWEAYEAFMRALEDKTEECGLSAVYYAWDEPSTKKGIGDVKLKRALKTYPFLKKIGVKALATTYVKAAEQLGPHLDIACYSIRGIARKKELREALFEQVRKFGFDLWTYAGGCYKRNPRNLSSNRFYNGLLCWKTGSKCNMNWTFQRPKGNPYCDFLGRVKPADLERRRARGMIRVWAFGDHDWCTTYPAPNGKSNIPTIQWEACREGNKDLRYLFMVQEYLSRAKSATGCGELAGRVEAELEEWKQRTPWREQDYTNAMAIELRDWCIDSILALRKALGEK